MTDKPDNTAPERIWASPEHTDEPSKYGFWDISSGNGIEYTRTDIAQAAIGAAVKPIHDALWNWQKDNLKSEPFTAPSYEEFCKIVQAIENSKRPEAVKAFEEIEARLKAEREKESIWVEALSEVIPDDCKDWRDAADEERPEIAASIIRNLRAREAALEVLLEKADMRTVRAALEKEGI